MTDTTRDTTTDTATTSLPHRAPHGAHAVHGVRHPGSRSTATHRAMWRHWPTGVAIALAGFAFSDLEPWEPSGNITWLLPVLALAYLAFGAARGELRRPGVLALQTAGLLAFGAVALVAVSVGPGLGEFVLAAGLVGHALWDLAHHRADRVVPRPYAEFCVVFDLLAAAALIAAALR